MPQKDSSLKCWLRFTYFCGGRKNNFRLQFRKSFSLEILRNSSTIFRSSHRRCSIKKAVLINFAKSTGKHPCCILFLIKLQASHLKNIQERLLLHFWKVFSKNFFGANFLHPYHSDKLYSDHSLVKVTFHDTKMVHCCVKDCSNQSRLNKNVSYQKILDEKRKEIRDDWIKLITRPVLRKA